MTDFIHFIGGKLSKKLLYAQNRQGVEISSRLLEGNSAKSCYMPKTGNAWTFHQLYSEKNIVLKAICNKTYRFLYRTDVCRPVSLTNSNLKKSF